MTLFPTPDEPTRLARIQGWMSSALTQWGIALLGLPVAAGAIILLSANSSHALRGLPSGCYQPSEVSCDFYRGCLESHQSCGSEGYAIGYGKKYCERFLALNTPYAHTKSLLSRQGLNWRNSTLLCLQQELVPILSKEPYEHPCSDIKTHAYNSHPKCYTLPENSICDLPLSDWRVILSTVDFGDTLSLDGIKQAKAVLLTCTFALRDERDDLKRKLLLGRLTQYSRKTTETQIARIRSEEQKASDRLREITEKLKFLETLAHEKQTQALETQLNSSDSQEGAP